MSLSKKLLKWFNHLKIRTKAIIVMVLVFVLLASGAFTILVQTGKLGIRADTNIKTVTVSGTSVNPDTNLPNVNVPIKLFTGGQTPVSAQAVTNSTGNYTVSIQVDVSQPENQILQVENGMSKGSEDSTESIVIPTNTTQTSFAFTKSWKEKEPPPDGGTDCNISGWYKKTVGPVVFCAIGTARTIFDDYPDKIQQIADQIVYLRGQTGHQEAVKYVLLVEHYDWWISEGYPIKYKIAMNWMNDYQRIALSRIWFSCMDSMSLMEGITHEVGHAIDYLDGGDFVDTNNRPYHNNFSWETSFYHAFDIGTLNGLTGYFTTNNKEFYAEIFQRLFAKLPSESNFVPREKYLYDVTNFMLNHNFELPEENKLTCSVLPAGYEASDATWDAYYKAHPEKDNSGIDSSKPVGPVTHNALMYATKAVAEKNHLTSPYSGTVQLDGTQWRTVSYQDIYSGKFMPVGLVSYRLLDHAQQTMGNTDVKIGGITKSTRLYKTSGVFSDGSGDLFDTNGTQVILKVQTNTSNGWLVDIPLMPSYYQGAAWLGQRFKVIQGSNPVFNLNFTKITVATSLECPACRVGTTQITLTSLTNSRVFSPLTRGTMTRYPTEGNLAGSPSGIYIVGGAPNRKEHSVMPVSGPAGSPTYIYDAINMPTFSNQSKRFLSYPRAQSCTQDYAKKTLTSPYTETCTYL